MISEYIMEIETKRLILRQFTNDDFFELKKILSDEETMKYYPKPYDDSMVQRWIEWNLDNYQKYGFGLWAICLKESGQFVGDCGLTMQNIDGEILPEIGYYINKRYWRRGYAKEAATAVRNWAFSNTKFDKLFSYMIKDNIPSSSTAISIGMTKEKEYFDKEGVQHCVYSISKHRWLHIMELESRFYSDNYAMELPKNCKNIKDLAGLFEFLLGIWTKETCAPRLQNSWSKDEPTVGQCSVTAFVIQDIFGGDVYAVKLDNGDLHCFNVIKENIVDFTSEQLKNNEIIYNLNLPQNRETHFKNKEKFERYLQLKKLFN